MKKKYTKWLVSIIALSILLLVSVFLSLGVGEVHFSPADILQIWKDKASLDYTILSQIRVPRLLLGFSVGGALSISGVILQGIYRNPLVEPYTLGISGGAALGVALTIVFGLHLLWGSFMLPLSGFAGAVITVFAVYFLSIRKTNFNINRMLLIGVMISFMASSTMMFLMATTTTENLHSIVFWIMGSLDEPDMKLINTVLYASIAGLLIAYYFSNHLNALRLGEEKAMHLGINTGLSIRILFIIASVLTGICVAVAGVIGFVGLVIPHVLRIFVGSDYRILLISSFLGGGIFILLSDLVARTLISPNELPIGVITGMVGGVLFILVLSRSGLTSKLK